jgi:hypothetical protein
MIESLAENLPLNDTWLFYDHTKTSNTDYETGTRILGTFDNVYDFWEYYNKLPGPSSLFYQTEYSKPYYMYGNKKREVSSISLFRRNIQPKWEDPKNKHGGELSLRKFYVDENTFNKPIQYLDNLWLLLCMAVVGEQFRHSEKITGIRVVDSSNNTPLYRIELWFSEIGLKDSFEQDLRKVLKLSLKDTLQFTSHEQMLHR